MVVFITFVMFGSALPHPIKWYLLINVFGLLQYFAEKHWELFTLGKYYGSGEGLSDGAIWVFLAANGFLIYAVIT